MTKTKKISIGLFLLFIIIVTIIIIKWQFTKSLISNETNHIKKNNELIDTTSITSSKPIEKTKPSIDSVTNKDEDEDKQKNNKWNKIVKSLKTELRNNIICFAKFQSPTLKHLSKKNCDKFTKDTELINFDISLRVNLQSNDNNNNKTPVSEASILVDGKKVGLTDEKGKFNKTINIPKEQRIVFVTIQKAGYKSVYKNSIIYQVKNDKQIIFLSRHINESIGLEPLSTTKLTIRPLQSASFSTSLGNNENKEIITTIIPPKGLQNSKGEIFNGEVLVGIYYQNSIENPDIGIISRNEYKTNVFDLKSIVIQISDAKSGELLELLPRKKIIVGIEPNILNSTTKAATHTSASKKNELDTKKIISKEKGWYFNQKLGIWEEWENYGKFNKKSGKQILQIYNL